MCLRVESISPSSLNFCLQVKYLYVYIYCYTRTYIYYAYVHETQLRLRTTTLLELRRRLRNKWPKGSAPTATRKYVPRVLRRRLRTDEYQGTFTIQAIARVLSFLLKPLHLRLYADGGWRSTKYFMPAGISRARTKALRLLLYTVPPT